MSSKSTAARVFRATTALFAAAKTTTAASKPVAKPKPKPAPKAAATAKPAKESTRLTGIQKPIPLSPELRSFMGVTEASRVEAVKQIWAHVKLNNLQNPANKREIYCDDKLKGVFDGRETVGFLEIGRLLSRHFIKTQ